VKGEFAMKLCDRCRVPGCLLNYLGPACWNARQEICPDVQLNRAEIITGMSIDGLANNLFPMLAEICEDGIPSPEVMREWLEGSPEEDDNE